MIDKTIGKYWQRQDGLVVLTFEKDGEMWLRCIEEPTNKRDSSTWIKGCAIRDPAGIWLRGWSEYHPKSHSFKTLYDKLNDNN